MLAASLCKRRISPSRISNTSKAITSRYFKIDHSSESRAQLFFTLSLRSRFFVRLSLSICFSSSVFTVPCSLFFFPHHLTMCLLFGDHMHSFSFPPVSFSAKVFSGLDSVIRDFLRTKLLTSSSMTHSSLDGRKEGVEGFMIRLSQSLKTYSLTSVIVLDSSFSWTDCSVFFSAACIFLA